MKPFKEFIQLIESSSNLILTSAPGTGKTFLAKEIAKELTNDTAHIGFVQFHPSYDYSDFVEGLRPIENVNGQIGFKRMDGVFKAFCAEALIDFNNAKNKEEEAPKYVFIIDEINRGEMSKIFGELFFSIDPGYRGLDGAVLTQYANMETDGNEFDKALQNGKKGQFFVPENVYIIGTMNDIDRSVESMDFAMRRRFTFKEIKADDRIDMWNDAQLANVEEIKKHMQCLNFAIEQIPGLSEAYHVGPSYFLALKNNGYKFKDLWDTNIKGLLFEYLRGMPDAKDLLEKLEDVYDNASELNDKKKQEIVKIMKS